MSDYSSCRKMCEDTKIAAVAIAEELIRDKLAAAETEAEECVAYCGRPPGFLESLSIGWILVGAAVFVALFFVVLYFAGQFCLTPLFPALNGKDCNKPKQLSPSYEYNTSGSARRGLR